MNGYRILFSEANKLTNTLEVFKIVGLNAPTIRHSHYMWLSGNRFHVEMALTKRGVSGGNIAGESLRIQTYTKPYGQFL